MKKIALAVLMLAAAGGAVASDKDAGRKIAEAQCAACHGADGKTPVDPSYPKIAGQYPDYLAKALSDYQRGTRKNAIMGAIAKPLSRQDIDNLAAYFGSLPGPLSQRR
jgi:cytochrome c553